jgi:heme exporter protein A
MGLEVTDLSCVRGGRRVLAGVGFALAPGETLVLRGPNGAGKSTLLRALAGLLPAGGTVALDGRRLDADALGEAVAYVGHLDAVKPQLSVRENLGFWAGLAGGDAAAAIAGFDLAAIADQPARLCSAGQKRRLALARLLVAPRRLWLLDEPTVSLDAVAGALFLAAVRAHAAGGGLAVIATHVALDLGRCRVLDLSPRASPGAAAGAAAADDPFLAGSWG